MPIKRGPTKKNKQKFCRKKSQEFVGVCLRKKYGKDVYGTKSEPNDVEIIFDKI